jgi:uncharacterized protein with FMN-binding domain
VSNGRSNKKVANSLVALSSAAVLSVYGAGYARTRAAADRIALQASQRRSHSRPAATAGAERAGKPAKPAIENPAPPATATVAEARVATPQVSSAPAITSQPPAPPAVASEPARSVAPDRAVSAPRKADADQEHAAAARRVDEPAAPPTASSTEPTSSPTEEAASAPAAVAATTPADAKARYRDGTYFGWGTSRHGDIQAAVLVEEGKIVSATVAQCLTRYSCAWIAPLPPRIVRDQGTTFDYVSGATESSDAFQDAVADALTHAQ